MMCHVGRTRATSRNALAGDESSLRIFLMGRADVVRTLKVLVTTLW